MPEEPVIAAVQVIGRADPVGPGDPVVPAVRAALGVPENPAVLAAQEDPAALVVLESPVVQAAQEDPAALVVLESPVVQVVPGDLVAPVAERDLKAALAKTRSAIAPRHRGRVEVPRAAVLAAVVAQTTHAQAATGVATVWAVVE